MNSYDIKKKRVLIVVPYITAFGGLERLLIDLTGYLSDNNIKYNLVCYECTIDLSGYAKRFVDVVVLPKQKDPFLRLIELQKFLDKSKEEQLGKILVVGLQAALHAFFIGLTNYAVLIIDPPSLFSPPVGSNSNLLMKIRSVISNIFIKRSLNKASWSSVMTEYIKSEIKALYGVNPIIDRPGIEVSNKKFIVRKYSQSKPFRILSVSRIEKSKRLDIILDSLGTITNNPKYSLFKRKWIFDVAGTGADLNRIKNMVIERGWQGKVFFHGHVNEQELADLFKRAHLFVIPARQGYGLPALESLTQGIPVLLHRESGVSEVLAGTPWVEVVNDEEFTAGLEKMINRVIDGTLAKKGMPNIPNSEKWAEAICKRNDWI